MFDLKRKFASLPGHYENDLGITRRTLILGSFKNSLLTKTIKGFQVCHRTGYRGRGSVFFGGRRVDERGCSAPIPPVTFSVGREKR